LAQVDSGPYQITEYNALTSRPSHWLPCPTSVDCPSCKRKAGECCKNTNTGLTLFGKPHKTRIKLVRPMNAKPLTLGDKVLLRDILRTILGDDDLRRGFRGACVATTAEMNRVFKKLEQDINDEVGAIEKDS